MRPVGETEFANGIAAMCSSGTYSKTRAYAGIVGHADLTLGNRVEPVLSALMRAGGERFRGIRHGVSWDADPSIVSPASPEMLANTFRPYVETCIEAFGASRSMFERNFPVDKVPTVIRSSGMPAS
jgi:hypothetical protein